MPLLRALIAEAAPHLPRRRRAFAAQLYVATLAGMGKHVSETARSRVEVDTWAAAIADMFLAHLASPRKVAAAKALTAFGHGRKYAATV